MRKHKKKKPPEMVAVVLALIASLLGIINTVLEIVLNLLDR